ncbi:MAG: hypothetical protein V1843_00515 [bacterium]
MEKYLKQIGIASSIIAFVLCLAAGIWLITNGSLKKEDALTMGLGIYFVGKAFFVGPMLLISTLKA